MRLDVQILNGAEDAEIFTLFLCDGGPWAEQINTKFPDIKKLGKDKELIANFLKDYKKDNIKQTKENIASFKNWWLNNMTNHIQEIVGLIELKSDTKNSVVIWSVSDCPICPRFLREWRFAMPASYWKWDAINVSLHEMCHFLWFQKIGELEGVEDFESLKEEEYLPYWYLSEIVIDTILNSTNFAKEYEMVWKAYPEFYEIKINGINIVEQVNSYWRDRVDFVDFYQKAKKYIIDNYDYIYKTYMSQF